MRPLNLNESFRLYTHSVCSNADWENPPFDGENYAALIIFLDSALGEGERRGLANELIDSKCRTVHAWGRECSRFAEIVLEEFRGRCEDEQLADKYWVMSLWHEDWPIDETVFSFLHCSEYGDVPVRSFLILKAGSDPEIEQEFKAAIDKELLEANEFWSSLPEDWKVRWQKRTREKRYKSPE